MMIWGEKELAALRPPPAEFGAAEEGAWATPV